MEAESGAEVRRLHVVYFLSRKGFVEHPHLIRIHHLSKNGVRLRDIKRWLGELRGEDMPESFSWSYKRKYKTGYVWQDLLDDDLVTPISDNEFVLKGSEISSTTNNNTESSETTSIYVPTKPSSEIEESSIDSETSTLTDEYSDKIMQEAKSSSFGSTFATNEKNEKKMNKVKIMQEAKSSSFGSTFVKNEKNEKKMNKVKIADSSSNKPNCTSNIFRSLITCGAVDTNDSALMMKNKSKIRDGAKDSSKKKVHFNEEMVSRPSYKPLNGPNCSQCGKQFKPEKLHAHMKSCKGNKASAKASSNPSIAATNSDNITQISTQLFKNEDSVSSYLLTR
ncbi:hypothetical protein ABFS83_14G160100 [Erythranthe nasuta]